ncbi:MAG: type II toxin-antitoxin system PemK/MazF family toxin, partial [Sphingomonadaceae bacterium]
SIPPAGPSLAWVLMITSALREDWPGDVRIPDHRAVGLPAPSKVRSAKIATVELDRTEPAGHAPADVMAAVGRHLAATLGWAAP